MSGQPLRHCLCAHVLLAFAVFGGVGVAPANGQLRIDVNRGNFRPLPIAVVPFGGDTPRTRSIGAEIARVVRSDLEGSGLFRAIPSAAFIQTDASISVSPRFADWRAIQAEALLIGQASIDREGRLGAQIRLFDVFANRQIYAQTYLIRDPSHLRRIGHIVADAIYRQLTGDSGYFDSKIAYISESGPRIARIRRLAIMDQDGANHEFITDGLHEVLTPRFSPAAQKIIYTSLVPDVLKPLVQRRRVYLYDLRTRRHDVVGNFEGMSFAARFSPDGRSLVMSLEENGNSDIYLTDPSFAQQRRLTTSAAIDTSPSFSPDNKRIVFNSDRTGVSHLYIMRADGKTLDCPSGPIASICRISFGDGRYSTPVWSPRGDLIAFTKQLNGKFHIGVLRPDGSGERLLTEAYLDEGPTWSPNGRVIAFFRESAPGDEPKLWSVDLSGRNMRPLSTGTSASDPAWGPLIQ